MSAWPPWLVLTIELGLGASILLAAVTVVLERRKPTATLAWILALFLLPVVGLLAYLLIGRRKVRRSRRTSRRRGLRPTQATAEVANLEHTPEDLSPQLRGLVHLAMRRAEAPVRRADDVSILPEPRDAFFELERSVASARHRIHMQFYIWRDDETGRRMIELLTERARAGVQVRVLYDEVGSLSTPLRHFQPLLDAGGQVGRYGSIRIGLRRPRGRLDFRNHRKLVTIDGNRGYVGGLNMANEYRGTTRAGRVWNDILVRLTGDAVLGIEAVFLDDWQVATGELVELDAGLPVDSGALAGAPMASCPSTPTHSEGPLVQIVASGPDQDAADPVDAASVLVASFLAAVSSAVERVWIVTPYLIPDEPLTWAMMTAAMRGVDVRLLVPNLGDNDVRLVGLAARSYYDELLAAGCRIYEYRLGMLHAKYMVIDSAVAVIGSANLDVRSLYLDYEITALFYDRQVTCELAEVFRSDLAGAEEVTVAERAALPWRWRFAEGAARILSPLL